MPDRNVEVHHRWSISYTLLLLQIHILRTVVRLLNYLSRDSPSYHLDLHRVKRHSVSIPSRQHGRSILLHIYTPKADSFVAEDRPVHVNWHGSGFVLPLLGDDYSFCAFLSATLKITVIDADYRKAPEYPFPACIQDAEDVLLHILAHTSAWDASNVTVGGFSAGANIAIGQCIKFGSRLRAVTAVYPPTDFRPNRNRRAPESCKGALPEYVTSLFDRAYILPSQDIEDPLLSVVLVDPKYLPPVLFVSTGRGDTLYYEGKQIIENALAAQHPDATFYSVEGVAHAWDKSVSGATEAKRNDLYSRISDAIKRSWR